MPIVLVATDDCGNFTSSQCLGFDEQKFQNNFYDNYVFLRDEDYVAEKRMKVRSLTERTTDADYHAKGIVQRPQSIGHYISVLELNLLQEKHATIPNLFSPLVKNFPDRYMVILYAFDLCIDAVSVNPLLLWESLNEYYPETAVIDSLFNYALYKTATSLTWHESISSQSNKYRSEIIQLAEHVISAPFIDVGCSLVLADTLIAIEKKDTALKIYAAIMAKEPESIVATNDIGYLLDMVNILESRGDFSGALDICFRVMEHMPYNPLVAEKINHIYIENEKNEELIDFWKTLAIVHPQAIVPLVYQGIALEISEKFIEAKQCYEQALQLDKNNFQALYRLGALQVKYGAREQGDMLLERALAQANNEERIGIINKYGNIARHFFSNGHFMLAVPYYRRAIALGTKDIGHYVDLGIALETIGKPEEAFSIYRQAIEQDSALSYVASRIDALYSEVEAPSKHLQFWKEIAEVHPGAVIPKVHLGLTYEKVGRVADAKQAFKEAIALDAKNVQVLCSLGGLLLLDECYEKGEVLLEKALTQPGQYNSSLVSNAFGKAAKSYYDQNDFSMAANYYRRAIDLNSADVGNFAYLGYALQALGDMDAALTMYHEVITKAPESPISAGRMDAIYLRQDKQLELPELWMKYVKIHPEAAIPHFHLGLAFKRNGMPSKALAEFNRALNINPNIDVAQDECD